MKTANRKYPERLLAELHELWVRFAVPPNRRRLITEQLTTEEVQSLQEGQGGDLEDLAARVSSREILSVVAVQRGWTRERALLDLAFGIDMIGPGRHQRLRKDIREHVGRSVPAASTTTASRTTPRWDRTTGKLHLGSRLIGHFRICKRPTRAHTLLEAFEESHWPSVVYQPFESKVTHDYVHSAVHQLNKSVQKIAFHVQAGAKQITWVLNRK